MANEEDGRRFRVPHDFALRPYQRRFWNYLRQGGRRAVWVVHRRGGKDLVAMHQTVLRALKRRGAYWHVFPTGAQARKAIWGGFTKDGQRIMEQVFPKEIRRSPKDFRPNAEMVVELVNGSIWSLMGSDHMDVVGAGPAGVVFSEFALARPKTWDLVRPMLRENEGWAAFVSTPRGKNHLWRLLEYAKTDPTWFWEVLTLRDTNAYDPDETIREELASGMPEELVEQEYMCSFTAALVGSIFGKLVAKIDQAGRITAFDHHGRDVYTTWDLGIDDSNAIWFWQIAQDRQGVDVIDHYESSGEPLSHYVDVLAERGYQYAKHFLPHDARHRNLLTGGTIEEQLRSDLGASRVVVIPKATVLDGIQAGRRLLQQPSTRIHARCGQHPQSGVEDPESGLEALRAYSRTWDDELKAFSSTPLHNWASHTGDAWRYVGLVAKKLEIVTQPQDRKPKPPTTVAPNEVRLDDLIPVRSSGRRV